MSVTDWLLDADPAIRWQVMRDITREPADVVAAERARVGTEGWGAQLLALQALARHRLCESTVGLLEEKGIASWTSAGAADRTEWVSQIRTVTTLLPPYQLQVDPARREA